MEPADGIEKHEYDVVVVGAGGAGLRAAIEAHESGARTAVVCKSLLGKAHTVMAEGGIAAAMGNLWPEDNWRVHFRDTMRGGKMLNHWRMAQLHAQEAPDRVRELEDWGALFDRTPDGLISQRDFGGHRYARLAHVGDRTGLELIRTLQQRTVALGIDVYMECTVTRLLTDDDGVTGAFGYWRESGRFVAWQAPSVVLATGGIGKSYKVTSNSWEYTGDGHSLALQAGATLVNMEFVQFHPTGMVWPPSVRGILVTESVRGDGGILKNSAGNRFMFDYIPDFFRKETAETEDEADRWYDGQEEQPASTRAAPPRRGRPRDQQRGQGRPRHRARRRLPRHRLAPVAGVHPQAAALDVPPVQGAGRGRHHHRGDGGRAHLPLRDGRGRGRPRHRGGPRARAVRGRRGRRRHARLQPAGRQLAVRPAGVRPPRRRGRRRARRSPPVAGAPCRTTRSPTPAGAALAPFEREGGENPYTVQHDLQQTMHDLVGIIRTAPEMEQALERIEALKERVANLSVEGHRQYNPGWHLALDLPHMLLVSECVARAALERQESRGGHTRDDFPGPDPEWGQDQPDLHAGARTAAVQVSRQPLPQMPPELAEIFEETA